jgi:CheY-like chemotaxis protein
MNRRIKVLLVEDSVPDATLIQEVVLEEKIKVDIDVVRDGEAAMAYLADRNQNGDKKVSLPELILLDLNLPKKDGREVLAEVKNLPRLRDIPVVILTTSQAEEDIIKCYGLQASCYLIKPLDLEQLTETIKSMDKFWFSLVRYPPKR